MKRVQQVPKDIDFIVYRFIHRDLMKQLNSEYKSIINVCSCVCCKNVCFTYIVVVFLGKGLPYNYRTSVRRDNGEFIYGKRNNACGALPKNY